MGNVSTTRRKGASKELEKYCKPTGLYETCPWEERVVRRWIMDGQVAPRFPGADAPSYVSSNNSGGVATASGLVGSETGFVTTRNSVMLSAIGGTGGLGSGLQLQQQQQQQQLQTEECPICFMHYQGVNRTTCCAKPLCTECYLQVRPPRSSVVCPFCNAAKFSVEYLGPPSKEDSDKRMAEEQRTIEARIRAEQEEVMRQVQERNARETSAAAAAAAAAPAPASGVGESGDAGGGGTVEGVGDGASSSLLSSSIGSTGSLPARASFATVAERRLTEDQIRNQHVPPPASSSRSVGGAGAAGRGGPSLENGLGGSPATQWRRHNSRRWSRNSSRRLSSTEHDNDSGSEFQPFQDHPEGVGGEQGEIQQVEDLMLMEALRLSVLEEQARRERSGDLARAAAAASTPGWANFAPVGPEAGAAARVGSGQASVSEEPASLDARISTSCWERIAALGDLSAAAAATTNAAAAPAERPSPSSHIAPAAVGATGAAAAAAAVAAPSDSSFFSAAAMNWWDSGSHGDSGAERGAGARSAEVATAAQGREGAAPEDVESTTEAVGVAGEKGAGRRDFRGLDVTLDDETEAAGGTGSLKRDGNNLDQGSATSRARSSLLSLEQRLQHTEFVLMQQRAFLDRRHAAAAGAASASGGRGGGGGGGGEVEYPLEVPESEEAQLMLAIALSLRSSSSGSSSSGDLTSMANNSPEMVALSSAGSGAAAGGVNVSDGLPFTFFDDGGNATPVAANRVGASESAVGMLAEAARGGRRVRTGAAAAAAEDGGRPSVSEDLLDWLSRERSKLLRGSAVMGSVHEPNSKLPAVSEDPEVTGAAAASASSLGEQQPSGGVEREPESVGKLPAPPECRSPVAAPASLLKVPQVLAAMGWNNDVSASIGGDGAGGGTGSASMNAEVSGDTAFGGGAEVGGGGATSATFNSSKLSTRVVGSLSPLLVGACDLTAWDGPVGGAGVSSRGADVESSGRSRAYWPPSSELWTPTPTRDLLGITRGSGSIRAASAAGAAGAVGAAGAAGAASAAGAVGAAGAAGAAAARPSPSGGTGAGKSVQQNSSPLDGSTGTAGIAGGVLDGAWDSVKQGGESGGISAASATVVLVDEGWGKEETGNDVTPDSAVNGLQRVEPSAAAGGDDNSSRNLGPEDGQEEEPGKLREISGATAEPLPPPLAGDIALAAPEVSAHGLVETVVASDAVGGDGAEISAAGESAEASEDYRPGSSGSGFVEGAPEAVGRGAEAVSAAATAAAAAAEFDGAVGDGGDGVGGACGGVSDAQCVVVREEGQPAARGEEDK